MKRGDIYFIANRNAVGGEIAKSRPAVIVSNNTLNATSNVVEVVYLTTQPKREMFTHVEINATGRPSTALCEQIDTISKTLVGDYFGKCSAEEMEDIDHALLASLGLTAPKADQEEPEEEQEEPEEEQDRHTITVDVTNMAEYAVRLIRLETERDVYKSIYEKILNGAVNDI